MHGMVGLRQGPATARSGPHAVLGSGRIGRPPRWSGILAAEVWLAQHLCLGWMAYTVQKLEVSSLHR
jgi:hypothetical protein